MNSRVCPLLILVATGEVLRGVAVMLQGPMYPGLHAHMPVVRMQYELIGHWGVD